jgi:hypothetical protein
MCLVEPYRRAARESVLATMQESGFLGFGRRAGKRNRKGDVCPDLRRARRCRLSTGVVMSGHPIVAVGDPSWTRRRKDRRGLIVGPTVRNLEACPEEAFKH